MILKSLWERYLMRKLLATFFLFVGSFFVLFALLDYTLHAQDFLQGRTFRMEKLLSYYGYHFIKQADLLLPLALLIASLRTLFGLNARGELVALLASGLSARTLMRPFVLLALLCTLFTYANYEYLLPKGLNYLTRFRNAHFKRAAKHRHRKGVHVLFLQDQSKILYSQETPDAYRDVYWLAQPNEIWHMQVLEKSFPDAKGWRVDHLVRGPNGLVEKRESHEACLFSGMHPQPDPTGKGYIPAENRALSELFALKKHLGNHEPARITTALVYKCLFPLFSLLIVSAVPLLGFRHDRRLRQFFAYALSLFAFIALVAFLDACVILGESEILSPYLGILLPFALLFALFGRKCRAL